MNDEFLINFAIIILVGITFVIQHICQFFARKIDTKSEVHDQNIKYVMCIGLLELIAIGIIIELMRYAFSK